MEALQRHDAVREKLVALLAGDRPDGDKLMASLLEIRQGEGVEACSMALNLLARLKLPEIQAERLLCDLLRHRGEVTRALGRDPGLRVAAIDYLSNVRPLLANPTIVERSQLERTERSAITDELTGLYNRRHFMSTLALEVRRSRRYSLRMALLMLDLDGFKQINDRHGHLFGDRVLQRMGRVIRRAVREADVPCRYGGEEFAVVLPETDRLGAFALAERVRRSVVERFSEPIGGQIARVRVSGGISAYPEDGNEAAVIVSRADEALYLSKSRGKDRISVYHSEQRRDVRYPAKAAAKIKLARPGDEAPAGVLALNLSRGGALLVCAESILSGTPVSLRFDGRDPRGRPRSWLHAGRVLRVESGAWPADGRRVAIVFDEPLPEDCLSQHVRRTRVGRRVQGARS